MDFPKNVTQLFLSRILFGASRFKHATSLVGENFTTHKPTTSQNLAVAIVLTHMSLKCKKCIPKCIYVIQKTGCNLQL